MHMDISFDMLRERLGSRPFRYLEQCESTNDLALALLTERGLLAARRTAELICTDEQTKGKGRLGRAWYAPPGTALMLSVILPLTDRAALPRMTMLGALAIAEMAEAAGAQGVGIKWPNDVQINRRKLSGVLSEAHWLIGPGQPTLQGVVLGMGINIRIDFSSTPFAETAISLEPAIGRSLNRADLLVDLLQRVEGWYARRDSDALLVAWRGRLNMLGQPIQVQQPTGLISGIAESVDADGALYVRDAAGQVQRVIAGDVALGGQ
jgi:BirA family biotin operon repressor/biotin-[acetyl-CoA-carboxylase] ligase